MVHSVSQQNVYNPNMTQHLIRAGCLPAVSGSVRPPALKGGSTPAQSIFFSYNLAT